MQTTRHHTPFILASQSPRRQQLLREAGYSFEVVPPPVPEPPTPEQHLSPAQQAEALAYFKARSVADATGWRKPVLGADTVVALGERIFGKPADAADARRVLQALAGTDQAVITGVALLGPGGCRWIGSQATLVRMRAMSEAEMDAYIASGAWEGKAGAYGIQDAGDAFVTAVEGSFSNVVGLPLELVDELFATVLPRMRACTPTP